MPLRHRFDHARFRVEPGTAPGLAARDPGTSEGLDDKAHGKRALEEDRAGLARMQELLWAGGQAAVLVVLQGMDTAGKDGVIRHVLTGVNPQGCEVHPFGVPTPEELRHDFLWRHGLRLPAKGRIGIFNRSHYEEVVVVRVHPELLAAQRLPSSPEGMDLWAARFRAINAWERHLVETGTCVLKFFLHVSKAEQRRRLLGRIDDPSKRWKFSMGDVRERARWDDHMSAYEAAIEATSTPWAPWYVVPADRRWFARALVADVICERVEGLGLEMPRIPPLREQEIEDARRTLVADEDG